MTWRWHPWGPLCCGLLSALAAIFLMQLYIEQQLQQQQSELEPAIEPPRMDVVVASEQLDAGHILNLAVLSARQVPRAGVATDTLHPAQANWLVGQQLAHPVSAGQPIQHIHLAEASGRIFSDLLKPGQRALTLNVSSQQSHSGLISVGDRVDFFDLSSVQPRLLDQAVEVIATGGNYKLKGANSEPSNDDYRSPADEYRTLTFAIGADKVPAYERLQRQHQLTFWLRASADQENASPVLSARKVDWIIGGTQRTDTPSLSEGSWL